MAGNYWIKLYTEILDDPKMAMLDGKNGGFTEWLEVVLSQKK